MASLTDPMRRGALLNVGGAAVGGLATVGLVVLTAAVLAPEDAGTVFAATSVVLVAGAVLRVGTPTAVVLALSRLDGDEARRSAPVVAAWALAPVAVAGGAAAALALLLAHRLGQLLHVPTAAVVLLACTLPAVALLDTVLALGRARGSMGPTVLIDRVGRPVAQVVLTAVAAGIASTTVLLTAWAVPYLVALAVAAVVTTQVLRRTMSRSSGGAARSTDLIDRRTFNRFALTRGVVGIVQLCYARLDIVLVAALAGPAEAALYTVATRFVVVVQLAQQAVGLAAEPVLGSALGRSDRAAARAAYGRTTLWLVTSLWPFLAVVAATSAWWLGLIDRRYVDAVPVVLVLAAAMAVAVGVGLAETVVTMAGRATPLLISNVAALAVMVGLDLALVPAAGATGAAVGWGAAIVAKNLVAAALARGILAGARQDTATPSGELVRTGRGWSA